MCVYEREGEGGKSDLLKLELQGALSCLQRCKLHLGPLQEQQEL